MKAHACLSIVTVALVASLIPRTAHAQDAAVANPDTVSVKLDNASVRVLESVLNPKQQEHVHSHPACVIYVISGGKIRNHMTNGESAESELPTGVTLYRGPITHWTENIGTSPIHLIVVELKDRK